MTDHNKPDNDIRDIINMSLMICHCVLWSHNESEDNKLGIKVMMQSLFKKGK